MFVLAYCAGLRMGEIVRLRVGDIRLDEHSLDIRETKFFKSRRLPLSATAMALARRYLETRCKSGVFQRYLLAALLSSERRPRLHYREPFVAGESGNQEKGH